MSIKNIKEAAAVAQELSRAGHAIPRPITKQWFDKAYAAGMIPKSQLKDGATYIGACRNAVAAIWDEKQQVFWYTRKKFSSHFCEWIKHPEDDNGNDLFIPVAKITPFIF